MASGDGTYGKIKWSNNWTTFMDCMLQLCIVQTDSRNLALPVKFRSMRIASNYHKIRFGTDREIEVLSSENGIIAGGVEIIDLKTNYIQRKKPPGEPVLEKYIFMPYFNAPQIFTDDIARCCVQLFLENCSSTKFSVVQAVITSQDNLDFLNGLVRAINKLPILQGNYVLLNMSNAENLNKSLVSNDTGIMYAQSADDLQDDINILLLDEADTSSSLLTLTQRLSANCMLLIKTRRQNFPEKPNLQKDFVPVALFPCLDKPYLILTLFRKPTTDCSEKLQNYQFIKISQYDDKFKWLDTVKHAIGKNLFLVAENEPCNGLVGLVNCLRKEPDTSNVCCIFIDDMTAPHFDPSLPFYRNQIKLGLAINIYRKGEWGSYRHLDLKPSHRVIKHTDHICGAIANVGDFSTIYWKKGQLSESDVQIRISYAALNFRDVMHASGRLSAEDIGLTRLEQSDILGLEYSGIDKKTGKAVMGMAMHSAIASYMEPNSIISWEVPSRWTLQEAATVPVVYTTVYYAFFYSADIRNAKDILIHSGSGGVGIAAIRTALAYGLEVYTTVSTTEKKKFLLKTFPQLKGAYSFLASKD